MIEKIAGQGEGRKRVGKGRKHTKVDRLTKAERRARLLERQEAWVQQWLVAAKVFVEALLNSEVADLLGRPARKWGDRGEEVEVRASCNKCGRKWRGWFRRNGTYPRTLAVEGVVVELGVPRVRCHCGGCVDVTFSVFAPYARLSPEFEERLREVLALGLTLRQVGMVTAPRNGGPLAKSTINERVLALKQLVSAFHQAALEKVPPVALLDGLWVKVLEPLENSERFTDIKGRNRPRVRRKKVGLLVAYGCDPGTGQWWVLDWERAEQEDKESWGRLLERLRERGLSAENGLKLIVSDGSEGLAAALELVDLGKGVRHQLCVFHRLRNIGKAVKRLLREGQEARDEKEAKEARRARRREVVKDAAAIYQGNDRAEILRRRDEFVAKWQESEPEAMATLLRDFEQTIAYVDVRAEAASRGQVWDVRYLRTTSALERLNRRLRTMARAVTLFHSVAGQEARVYLVLMEAGEILIRKGEDWQVLVEDALAAA